MSSAVFAYGSLVSRPSAAATLGRDDVEIRPASLRGHVRSFSLARDNRACEKTFARRGDGWIPDLVLALNVAAATGNDLVSGALLTVTEAELERLDVREIRYRRIDVSDAVEAEGDLPTGRIHTYVARPEHHAPEPPPGAVILASYERTVEAAFAGLGPGELDRYRATTLPSPAERIEADLVADAIPEGNPREW